MSFLLELHRKYDLLRDWSQFFESKQKKETLSVSHVYQFVSRNKKDINKFIDFAQDYFSFYFISFYFECNRGKTR